MDDYFKDAPEAPEGMPVELCRAVQVHVTLGAVITEAWRARKHALGHGIQVEVRERENGVELVRGGRRVTVDRARHALIVKVSYGAAGIGVEFPSEMVTAFAMPSGFTWRADHLAETIVSVAVRTLLAP